jgi:hypothetical protein
MRVAIILTLLGGCASVPSEIQGTWSASGDLGDQHSWQKEYVIDGDGFEMSGYPPISEKCDLELLSTEGSVHTLRATDCVESGPGPEEPGEDHDVRVEVLEGAISWDGQRLQRQ